MDMTNRKSQVGSRHPTIIYRLESSSSMTTIELQNFAFPTLFLVSLMIYLFTLSGVAALTSFTLGFLLSVAYLWSYKMAKGVHGERILLSAAVQVGDEIEEQFVLTNESYLPVIWAEIFDRSTLPGYNASMVVALGSNGSRKWSNNGICSLRGVYTMGPWEIHMGDPFGIFFVRQVIQDKRELVVYPPLAEVPAELIPQSSSHGDTKFLQSFFQVDSTQAFTTRAYVQGDPSRHIHWRTTARRGDLFVKGFEPESRSIVWILPDCDARVHTGSSLDSTEEKMVILVASLAKRLLDTGICVGLLSHTDRVSVLEPSPGLAQFWRILRALSSLRATPSVNLASQLSRSASVVSPGTLLVAVTPSTDIKWVEAWKKIPQFGAIGLQIILLDPTRDTPSKVDHTARRLKSTGVQTRSIKTHHIEPVVGSYGELRRWEFKILPIGKAIVVQRPRPYSPELQGKKR